MNWPFCRRIKIPLDFLENVVQEQPSSDSLGIKKYFQTELMSTRKTELTPEKPIDGIMFWKSPACLPFNCLYQISVDVQKCPSLNTLVSIFQSMG